MPDELPKLKVLIDNEFRDLWPPLAPAAFAILRTKLLQEGLTEPLVAWMPPDVCALPIDKHYALLVDGHHRRKICMEQQIELRYRLLDLKTREDVILWIRANQKGRRNLTEAQLAYNRGEELEKKKDQALGHRDPKSQSEITKEVAEEHNVSESTIKRNLEFKKAVAIIRKTDPFLANQIVDETSGLSRREVLHKAGMLTDKKDGYARTGGRGKTRRYPKNRLEFDYKAWKDHIGKAIRCCDEYGKLTGTKDGTEHSGLLRLAHEFLHGVDAWKARMQKEREDKF
jgi:hypothetical protein